jgi:hypothetical protein
VLGPGDGRYVLRPEGDPDARPDVLVIGTLGAAAPGGLRLRRPKPRESEPGQEPDRVPVTRVTVVRARPFAGDAEAESWLDRVASERELSAALAGEAARALNRALHAHRTAAGDPHVADVDPSRALAVRFGYGTGEDLADGRWREARELPDSERRRLLSRDYEALRPQERIAAVLGGRERVGAHEELILRARGDLDAGRTATAALGLAAGIEALLALPEGLPTEANEELRARLEQARESTARAREAVLGGAEADPEALERALRAAETAVRQRALH